MPNRNSSPTYRWAIGLHTLEELDYEFSLQLVAKTAHKTMLSHDSDDVNRALARPIRSSCLHVAAWEGAKASCPWAPLIFSPEAVIWFARSPEVGIGIRLIATGSLRVSHR